MRRLRADRAALDSYGNTNHIFYGIEADYSARKYFGMLQVDVRVIAPLMVPVTAERCRSNLDAADRAIDSDPYNRDERWRRADSLLGLITESCWFDFTHPIGGISANE